MHNRWPLVRLVYHVLTPITRESHNYPLRSLMSHAKSASSLTPNFKLIFNNALESYKKSTKNDLLTHPLAVQLQDCTSSSAVLALIHQQVQGPQRDDDSLTRWLDPTVRVLYAFSETLGEGVSLVRLMKRTNLRSTLSHLFPGILSRESDIRRSQCSSLSAYPFVGLS